MLREIGDVNVRVALAKRLRRGESLPGFGHKLYPDGDPRARLLLDSLAAAFPNSETLAFGSAVCAAAKELTGQEVNIDFGLVMLADMLELPDGAALALFAIGRTVGWIGHVLEQYGEDRLIRPRARYTGRLPGD
jgi:citrate synthase